MHRRDCLKIGAASVVGLVSLAGCIGPGGDDDDEGGGGGGEEGEGGGEEDDIESDAQDVGDAFASSE